MNEVQTVESGKGLLKTVYTNEGRDLASDVLAERLRKMKEKEAVKAAE